MALKSESASQMDHLQALEKVSPKLDLVKVDTEIFPVLFALRLYVLLCHICPIWDKKIIMK